MANPTSNFGWQMPTPVDLVTDLPADFEVFGQAVDSSLADLKGGTSGQVLSKNSNTDMDFVWVTSDDANAIQNTIVDAKGDLIGATAADTPARLAVGTNGQVLTADSTAATGLAWATPSGGSNQFFAGKNKFINGDLTINQRAFTSTTTSGTYTFDRWACGMSDGTVTVSAQVFTPGTAPVAGYEFANYARIVTSGQTATNASANYVQRIEDVRTFANQTVTVSFWAKAGSGTPQVAIGGTQNFGVGGSTFVRLTAQKVTLSTSWARYSATLSIPSMSGKTLGTSSTLIMEFWVSSGSDFASRTDTLGIQNNTFEMAGFQIEAGSSATDFQTATGTIQGELAACQRYFQKSYDQATAPATANQISGMVFAPWAANVGNGSPFAWTKLHQTMRTTPTLTFYSYGGTAAKVSDNNNTDLAANSAFVTRAGESGFGLYNNSGGTINTGNNGFLFHWIGSAEL